AGAAGAGAGTVRAPPLTPPPPAFSIAVSVASSYCVPHATHNIRPLTLSFIRGHCDAATKSQHSPSAKALALAMTRTEHSALGHDRSSIAHPAMTFAPNSRLTASDRFN